MLKRSIRFLSVLTVFGVFLALMTIQGAPSRVASAQSKEILSPLPHGCIRVAPFDDPDASCAYGYVYHNDKPIAGATVRIESADATWEGTTADYDISDDPHYQVDLKNDLHVTPGDEITITVSYNDMVSTRTWTVQPSSQQVDVGLIEGYQATSPLSANSAFDQPAPNIQAEGTAVLAGASAVRDEGQVVANVANLTYPDMQAITTGEPTAPNASIAASSVFSITEVKLTASDIGKNDQLGTSVSVSGDVALVGARLDDDNGGSSGAAYIYRWDGSQWQEESKLLASDGVSGDLFGGSVSIDRNVALVGAFRDDDNGFASGSAYIYRWNGSQWQEESKLLASDGVSGDHFGGSVSIDGNVALVGATGGGDNGFASGSAYIYRWDGSQWQEESKLLASDGAIGDHFGRSVSIDGNVALVGASGSAYIYRWNGSQWQEESKLLASDGAHNFGSRVSIDGNVALVGASGSAYLFRWHGSHWVQEAKLTASDGASWFGRSVSIDLNVALIGARDSAYIYRWNGSLWQEERKLLASDGASSFGGSVSIDGDAALVGATENNDDIEGENVGAAYLYNLASGTVPDIALNRTSILHLDTSTTYSLTIKNAGYETLSWSLSSEGAAWLTVDATEGQLAPAEEQNVALGLEVNQLSPSAYRETLTITSNDPDEPTLVVRLLLLVRVQPPSVKLTGNDRGDVFGSSVSIDGNVALVGASGDEDNGNASGSAYIYRWDGQWVQEAKLTASDGVQNDYFGRSVSIDGDVALLGSRRSAYIFRWNGSQWVEEAKLTASDGASAFGGRVSIDGDVALVGAYADDDKGPFSGSAYIFRWNGSQWVEAKLTASDGAQYDMFGYSVSIDGDVALVGASGDEDNGEMSGSAYIFRWDGSQWQEESKLLASDGGSGDEFGNSVSLDGNVALVGASCEMGCSNGGSAYIYRWDGSQWVEEAKLTASNRMNYDRWRSVSLDGNLALVGVEDPVENPSSGSAYLFRWDGSQWVEVAELTPGEKSYYFGDSVSINGNTALVGDLHDDDNGQSSGAVYMYDLSSLVGHPEMTLSPASLSVALDEGESSSETLVISNRGASDLDWQVSGSAAWLSVAPASGTVAASGSQGVTVDIDATSLTAGRYTDTLTITSNDPDEPSVEVPVEVTVSSPGSSNLLAIYALAFDNSPTSSYSLAANFPETMQSIFDATIDAPDKRAIVLIDLPESGNTHIRVVQNGVETLLEGLPDEDGNLSLALDEYDMADGATLGGFLKWALDTYADQGSKTIFSYVGHGAALIPESGTAVFPENNPVLQRTPSIPLPSYYGVHPNFTDDQAGSVISPYDLAVALNNGTNGGQNPITVLDLVHCFSATIEQFYELSNPAGSPYATTMTGSPNYAYLNPRMLGIALAASQPSDDASTLASNLIATYDTILAEDDSDPSRHPRLLVAMDSSKIADIQDAWDHMSTFVADEFALNHQETKDKITNAYSDSLKYDTTFCESDWSLDAPDGLVDMVDFAYKLSDEFGVLSEAGTWAETTKIAVEEAIIAKRHTNGQPWFANVDPLPTWNFDTHDGIALYADFQGMISHNHPDTIILNWQAHWYTDEVSEDNPHPYAFVRDTQWDDVMQTFWQGENLSTMACMPPLPPAVRSGEVSADRILFPLRGMVTKDYPVSPSVVISISGEETPFNPLVEFSVTQNDTIVFSDTVSAGTLVTGTYQVEASQSWLPDSTGPFTLTVTVDADNRVQETNESDNKIIVRDRVLSPLSQPRPVIEAQVKDGAQWVTTQEVKLDLSQSEETSGTPARTLAIQLYQYQAGDNPNSYVPVQIDRQVFRRVSLPSPEFSLTLPDSTSPGPVLLHIWALSAGGLSVEPQIIEFNYIPPNSYIEAGKAQHFIFRAQKGERLQIDLNVQGDEDANLFVWDPLSYGPPIWRGTDSGNDTITIDRAPADGKYVVSVYGETNATYSLNRTANVRGMAYVAQESQESRSQNNREPYVPEGRPTIIEPIADVPPPTLYIPSAIPTSADSVVEVPVNYTSYNHEIASLDFSIDFDESCLAFDPTDSDGDGIPNNINFTVPVTYSNSIIYDANDSDGELDFTISSPATTIPDGTLATISLSPTCQAAPDGTMASVGFSSDPVATFNDSNNQAVAGTTDNGSVLITDEPPVSIPLLTGWNLVSLPVHPESTAIADVLAGIEGNYSAVYAYDGCDTADYWKSYDPNVPPFINDLHTLDVGIGIWIKMTAADTLELSGTEPASTTMSLCEGWNLVGYPSLETREITDAVSGIEGAYNVIYAFEASDQNDQWKSYDPNVPPFVNDLNEMKAGDGYWIKANQATQWQINN